MQIITSKKIVTFISIPVEPNLNHTTTHKQSPKLIAKYKPDRLRLHKNPLDQYILLQRTPLQNPLEVKG